jgi:hypothetical protein
LFAQTYGMLGSLLVELGELEAGEAEVRRGVAAYEALIAERDSPELRVGIAFTRTQLAPVLRARGEFDEAEAVLQRSLADKVAVFGSLRHPHVEFELKELAATARERGDTLLLVERELDLADFFDVVRGPGTRATETALRFADEELAAAEARSEEPDFDHERLARARARRAEAR